MIARINMLSEDTRRSLLAGYSFEPPFMQVFIETDARPEDYPDPEAYRLGRRLHDALSMMATADLQSEYSRDLAEHDAVRDLIHQRYGDGLVVDASDPDQRGFVGIIGHRVTRWTHSRHVREDGTEEEVDRAELCREQSRKDLEVDGHEA